MKISVPPYHQSAGAVRIYLKPVIEVSMPEESTEFPSLSLTSKATKS